MCAACAWQQSQQNARNSAIPPSRPFATSHILQKKGAKAAREEKAASSKSSSGGKDASSDDPFDFSTLEADIATTVERLKNDLSKLRAGGRFNPEALENLRVQPEKANSQTVKLSDLAQVIPKGRVVQIMVGEKEVRRRTPQKAYRRSLTPDIAAHETNLLSHPILQLLPQPAT